MKKIIAIVSSVLSFFAGSAFAAIGSGPTTVVYCVPISSPLASDSLTANIQTYAQDSTTALSIGGSKQGVSPELPAISNGDSGQRNLLASPYASVQKPAGQLDTEVGGKDAPFVRYPYVAGACSSASGGLSVHCYPSKNTLVFYPTTATATDQFPAGTCAQWMPLILTGK